MQNKWLSVVPRVALVVLVVASSGCSRTEAPSADPTLTPAVAVVSEAPAAPVVPAAPDAPAVALDAPSVASDLPGDTLNPPAVAEAPPTTAEVAPSIAPATSPPSDPVVARAIPRWCLVAEASQWVIACDRADHDAPNIWVPVHCHWETAWDEVPWDVMPTTVTREGRSTTDFIDDAEVARLATCSLGITPRSAIGEFVALPPLKRAVKPIEPIAQLAETTPEPSVAAEPSEGPEKAAVSPVLAAKTPAPGAPEDAPEDAATAPARRVVRRALPVPVAIQEPRTGANPWLLNFEQRVGLVSKVADPFDLSFSAVWRFDANQDGKDEEIAVYAGTPSYVAGGEEGEDSFQNFITEGLVWRDGRRPKSPIDFNINESSDEIEGLEACGLIEDASQGLPAVVLHDSGTFGCAGAEDSLFIATLNPKVSKSTRVKPVDIDPWPMARVRDPEAGIFNRKWTDLGAVFGFRPGMSLAEVVATLNSGKAPPLPPERARMGPDQTLTLASGPIFRFDGQGHLAGLTVPSPEIAEALRVRGFDAPILDVIGQGANSIARALAGRRPGTFIFDGAVDKVLGLTLTLEPDADGRIKSFDIQWYARRRHLEASPLILGLRFGAAPDKLPRKLASHAVATDSGWTFAAAGLTLRTTTTPDHKRQLAAFTATALPSPSPLLADSPFLSLVGGPLDALINLLGPPDEGAETTSPTWLAPSPHRPAWALRVTVGDGRVQSVSAEPFL